MAYKTEDEVRLQASRMLGLDEKLDGAVSGTGQITTFNQLGFPGVNDKPDGWYLPDNTAETAAVFEFKAENVDVDTRKCVDEIRKNCNIISGRYGKVVGVLYNGRKCRCWLNGDPVDVPDELQPLKYYLDKFVPQGIDKETIYGITQRINDCLHSEFGIKNLYHRMIFTACALVAKRYGAFMAPGMDYSTFHNSILKDAHNAFDAFWASRPKKDYDLYFDVYCMSFHGDLDDLKGYLNKVPQRPITTFGGYSRADMEHLVDVVSDVNAFSQKFDDDVTDKYFANGLFS